LHYKDIAKTLMPPAPKGTVIKCRMLKGNKRDVPYFSGGFFKEGTTKARGQDLHSPAILSFDCDGADNGLVQEACGFTATDTDEGRAEVKRALYGMEEEEVRDLFLEVDFLGMLLDQTAVTGLPHPNRILYTGHGYQFLYFIPPGMGIDGAEWNLKRMKQVLSRAISAGELAFIDDKAKDIGTRIVPIPGHQHRNADKLVTVEAGAHDLYPNLTAWFENMEAMYPAKVKATKRARLPTKSTAPKSGAAPSGGWSHIRWDEAVHPELDVDERCACPLCGRSGYRRMSDSQYTCFSCLTQFKVPPTGFQAPNGAVTIKLDANGRALWPTDRPDFLVLKTATGSGKTWLLEQMAVDHKKPWMSFKKVLGIAPFKSLAEQLAFRLNIDHGFAGSDVSLRTGSIAITAAALVSKVDVLNHDQLSHVHVMIDESETVLGQYGSMLVGERATESYNKLLYVCAMAGKVTLCDQNAGAATALFIEQVNALRASKGKVEHVPVWWVSDHYHHDFTEVLPVYRTTAQGEQVVETGSGIMLKGLVESLLSADNRLTIFMWGKAACEGYAEMLRDRHPTLDIRCVTGSKSNASTNDLSQPALTCDVLIYNAAMSTGVSIDVADHYDYRVIFCGNNPDLGGDTVEQAAHRCRNPKNPEIYIAGADRQIINDWRCNAAAQLRRAEQALTAEDATAKLIAKDTHFTLRSDFHASPDAQRLGALQSECVASQYRRGMGWPLEYLKTRHAWTTLNTAAHPEDLSALHREAVAEVKDQQAMAVAVSVPLSEAQLDRVQQAGAEDDAEADAAYAARMVKCYGNAYTNATIDEMKELVKKHRAGLLKKVDVYAQARVFYEDPALHRTSLRQLKRANKNRTVMTIAPRLNKAVLLYGLLNELEQFRVAGALEIEVPTAGAVTAIRTLRPHAKRAALKLRDDWATAPIRQLQQWLKLGNLKLVCRQRGPRGSQTRHYFLTDSAVNTQNRLSQTRFDAFTTEET
jgi:hypothetical protein